MAEVDVVAPAGAPPHDANLLGDLEALGARLERAARDGRPLDAFLLAAGINQITEDYLHATVHPFDDAASLLRESRSRGFRLAGSVAGGTGWTLRASRAAQPGERRARAWQRQTAALVDRLAAAALAPDGAPAELLDRCLQLVREIPSLPRGLRRAAVRLPACFHDFDQRPEDLEDLAQRFADRWTDRDSSLLVAGVRTSGSYLAPLIAAALRARGYRRVRTMTIRPGQPLLAHERALVRSVVRARGQVLLTDDPPVTGSSLVAAAAQLERLGVARRLVLLLAVEDELGRLPAAVASFDAVVLADREWNIETRLSAPYIRSGLAKLLEDELELRSIEPLPLPGAARRRAHRRALFRVRGVHPVDGSARQLDVLAAGAGLGYLGAHQLMVARALSAFAPRVLGVEDGVLFREWLPGHRRLRAGSDEFAAAAAAYVAARRQTLSVARDMSMAMRGQRPVWEVVALMLARAFGPAAPVMRLVLVNRAVRRLLPVERPSVVDGNMTREHWFTDDGDGRAVKVGLSDRSYGRLGLACFDASFDLAGAAVSPPDEQLAAQVRGAWLAQTGEHVEPERWLLYELAHLWGLVREDPAREADVRRGSARAAARYFADAFLADLEPSATGPLCALDIDGVLETDQLGFPTPTRASATALRALVAHGYRPVLATGRGIAEVQDRCRAYGLEAGVAEYGCAICLEGGNRTRGLVDPDSAAALARLRAVLIACPGVRLDPAFAHAIRAYRVAQDGRRRPLGVTEVAGCLEASGSACALRAIPGENQTDFIPATVDKGTGLRALCAALEAEGTLDPGSRIALAVGDTASDTPMLALASAAFVPAHAAPAVTAAGGRRVERPYQAGLYRAVGELLGHEPGTCRCCRVSPPTRQRDLLLDLLSIAEGGRGRLVRTALGLAWKLR